MTAGKFSATRQNLNIKALFKPKRASHLLIFSWPKQVARPSSESLSKGLHRDRFRRNDSLRTITVTTYHTFLLGKATSNEMVLAHHYVQSKFYIISVCNSII